jgi:hypothetical protein
VSQDLPAYGIEGRCVAWRTEAATYHREAHLDLDKGSHRTSQRLTQLKDSPNFDFAGDEEKEALPQYNEKLTNRSYDDV